MRTKAILFVLTLVLSWAIADKHKMHLHMETEETSDGGFSILSPFYLLFGYLGEPGQKINSWLRSFSSYIPAALLTVPALTLTTLTVGTWTLIGWLLFKRAWNWYTFKRALKATHSGPVTVIKEYHACTRGQGEKMGAYVQNHIVPYVAKQPGLLRYQVHRGLGSWGQNTYCVVTDWVTLEDLRKAICAPEATNLRKNAPWSLWVFGVPKCISQPVIAGQGPAGRAGETTAPRSKIVA
jgi:heme-degrading monooxygenase HmoA